MGVVIVIFKAQHKVIGLTELSNSKYSGQAAQSDQRLLWAYQIYNLLILRNLCNNKMFIWIVAINTLHKAPSHMKLIISILVLHLALSSVITGMNNWNWQKFNLKIGFGLILGKYTKK